MISSHIFEDDHAVWGEDDTNTLKQHTRLSCQTNLKLAKLAYPNKPALSSVALPIFRGIHK